MTPLVAAPAIAELLRVPQNNPLVNEWVGRLLWIAALCGGVFGLLGGWLVDKLGRKTVMALSIFVYSLSPFCAAYAQTLPVFVFFRSILTHHQYLTAHAFTRARSHGNEEDKTASRLVLRHFSD